MAGPAQVPQTYSGHGRVRGLSPKRELSPDTKLRVPEDPKFEGLFGRMFRLPGASFLPEPTWPGWRAHRGRSHCRTDGGDGNCILH
jgi:hypothetical protein